MVPPPASTTLKVTPWFTAPVTLALNAVDWPGATVTAPGPRLSCTGRTVTVEAALVAPSAACAVTLQLDPTAETLGAVKSPLDGLIPPPLPAGVHTAAQ